MTKFIIWMNVNLIKWILRIYMKLIEFKIKKDMQNKYLICIK